MLKKYCNNDVSKILKFWKSITFNLWSYDVKIIHKKTVYKNLHITVISKVKLVKIWTSLLSFINFFTFYLYILLVLQFFFLLFIKFSKGNIRNNINSLFNYKLFLNHISSLFKSHCDPSHKMEQIVTRRKLSQKSGQSVFVLSKVWIIFFVINNHLCKFVLSQNLNIFFCIIPQQFSIKFSICR